MTPSIVIVGFETDYSNQIRQLLQYAESISSIRIHDRETCRSQENSFTPCWNEDDIALINGFNPGYTQWLKDCLASTSKRPPASLIIGDSDQRPEWDGEERRDAPRLHLSDAQLTGNKLIDAIQRLASSMSLPPINRDEYDQPADGFQLEDSSVYRTQTTNEHKPVADKPQLQPGKDTFIGSYQLQELLGVGGMATVYKAVAADQQEVAVKLFDPEVLADDRALDRFIEEYELLSTVKHTNVVTVYEQGFTDNHAYIAMQLLEKECLKSRIKNGLTVIKALQYAIDISHALSTIHELGILHRDLKPNNILFDQNGRAVITDFGIAKGTGFQKSLDLTLHGETVGTPAYMSPEQALDHELTTSSDLYAFGVMLYRMLTGKLPFRAKTPIDMMRKHIESPPPHLPPDLVDIDPIVQRLLCKQPAKRYQSARDVHDELIQFVC